MYKSNFFHPLPHGIIIFSDADFYFFYHSVDVWWALKKNKNKSDRWKERQIGGIIVGGCKGHLLHQLPSNVNDMAAGAVTGRTSRKSKKSRRSRRYERTGGPGVPGGSRRFRRSERSERRSSRSGPGLYLVWDVTTRVTFHHLFISKQVTGEIWPSSCRNCVWTHWSDSHERKQCKGCCFCSVGSSVSSIISRPQSPYQTCSCCQLVVLSSSSRSQN